MFGRADVSLDVRRCLRYHFQGRGCPRCGGKVFEAEKVEVKAGVFHRHCFR